MSLLTKNKIYALKNSRSICLWIKQIPSTENEFQKWDCIENELKPLFLVLSDLELVDVKGYKCESYRILLLKTGVATTVIFRIDKETGFKPSDFKELKQS